ncbi:2-succinyl-5-enolpyruvyl-6-hydroxy-3-cyclohexene-1-carboxylic-acid synthase [Constantimarinum furrinae]|uniref:2-succinyl-5-enolpyruvyl-6-hydroxy-3-cyclohexene-1-carboxylate synthase n=1 Tax=Constantimarinum furrinae TaxID=2562285 RepID=A0A7G8PXC5_9FLAO|nr:2-succinyl-5-enolpyruvyl-6-hydroxy-3-cyclohexene-1-carboxylic-acid synthase [Constantimarinum furrinae]QNJ98991.1 2-succinyl-5-enolpyruvyl-6-hydroxy-3-cyclohexene-1-carboxylate synthase [Constantimarinum furrinae]
MRYSAKLLSQTITQLCLAKGIDHVVISPGSRNAPLTIGFTEHPSFKNFSIVDERCAAFFALGMAQQLKKPVALVCTSGSALLNYYPAIAEAFYSDIPLVVLSADRPPHLIDLGDGQTIRQENVFSNHILYSANCRVADEELPYNETEINTALHIAINDKGPVHINVPFDEPLYGTVDLASVQPESAAITPSSETITQDLNGLLSQWNSSTRKMILVGVLDPKSIEQQWLDKLAEDESVIVLTETTSNLHHKKFFSCIDQLIAPIENNGLDALQPEILITFGGMIVSKKVKAFLRKLPPKVHWHIDPKKAYDTFFALQEHVKVSPNHFLQNFLARTTVVKSDYQSHWLQVRSHRRERHKEYVQQIPFSDFTAYRQILASLPEACQLQISNSAAIRYAQLFELRPSVKVFCNRGTSGIDGSTSTAIGAAVVVEEQVVFVSGDLSFFYDSNALWNSYIPKNFRIVVVNNGGGGIFRILPGAKDTQHFSDYFETRHDLNASQLCEMFKIGYRSAATSEELQKQLHEFYTPSESPQLLEIFTPYQINDKVLLDYFKFIT